MTLFTAFSEVSSRVRGGLNFWWRRGKSFAASAAASVPSDAPTTEEVRKGRKRLRKAERKALVESFIHKYREANSGKFPTVTDTKKELGGSHYVIREILQEMRYKESVMKVRDETVLKKGLGEENGYPTEAPEVLGIQLTVDAGVQETTHLGLSSCEQFEEKEEPQTSVLVENTFSAEFASPTTTAENSQDVAARSDRLYVETKEVSHDCIERPEDHIEELSSEEMLNHDFWKPKAEQPQQLNDNDLTSNSENHQLCPNLEKSTMDSLEKKINDEEPQKKQSMWRSLANGIINFWRKL